MLQAEGLAASDLGAYVLHMVPAFVDRALVGEAAVDWAMPLFGIWMALVADLPAVDVGVAGAVEAGHLVVEEAAEGDGDDA